MANANDDKILAVVFKKDHLLRNKLKGFSAKSTNLSPKKTEKKQKGIISVWEGDTI